MSAPPPLSKTEFAPLARASGVTLTEAEIDHLYVGYALLQRLVAELGRPDDAALEPAVVFRPTGTA